MNRGRWLVVAASGLFALVVATTRGAEPVAQPRPLSDVAGPVSAAPDGATGVLVAEDEAALQAALAQGVAEIALRERTYRGDFVVRRPVIVHGGGATLEGSGTKTVLQIDADDVVVEDLHVRHSGRRHTTEDAGIKAKGARVRIHRVRVSDTLFGISLGQCPGCVVERAAVEGSYSAAPGSLDAHGGSEITLSGDGIKVWESNDAVVRECSVMGARDLVVWYSKRVELDRNIVRGGRYGSHLMYAQDAWVHHSDVRNNVVGIFVMYSTGVRLEDNVMAGARGPAGVGIGLKESDRVRITGNWLVANTVGIYLDRSPRVARMPVEAERNVIAVNDVGLRFHSSSDGVHFTHNSFRENTTVAEVEGGGDALGVAFRGNYWSDYAGYDLDGDGQGDVPHELTRLYGELTDAHPALAFFHGTSALSLIDVVARVAPVFASRQLLVDPTPAMNELR